MASTRRIALSRTNFSQFFSMGIQFFELLLIAVMIRTSTILPINRFSTHHHTSPVWSHEAALKIVKFDILYVSEKMSRWRLTADRRRTTCNNVYTNLHSFNAKNKKKNINRAGDEYFCLPTRPTMSEVSLRRRVGRKRESKRWGGERDRRKFMTKLLHFLCIDNAASERSNGTSCSRIEFHSEQTADLHRKNRVRLML